MPTDNFTWEQLTRTVQLEGDSPDARYALNNDEPLPPEEVAVVEENDEVVEIVVGTPTGNLVISEIQVTYPDGTTMQFDNDNHRDVVVCAELPDYIVNSL